jgi:PAS domain S-box-containing protein
MKYKFSELIEVAKVQRLNDLFYTATGIPAAVIDLGGAIVTCSGWQEICTKFHRVNEGTAQQCVESDTVLANQIGVGQKYTVYKCGNGLVVAASPIVIGGGHVANFVTSQFLFHPPDRDSFLEQAKRFGFDEAAYMEAVGKIPVIDESKLPPFLEYFSEFAALLGEMGLKQLKQLEAKAGLRESEQRWASTLSSVGDAVIAADKGGRITFMNTAAEGLTGWTPEAAAKPVTEVFNIINERTREAVDNPVTKVLQKGMIVGLANDTVLLSRDGSEIPLTTAARPSGTGTATSWGSCSFSGISRSAGGLRKSSSGPRRNGR